MTGTIIGIIFIVFVLVRALLGKDDSDTSGPPWTRK